MIGQAGWRVRPATAADVAQIAQLHWDSWVATYTGVFPQAAFDEYSVQARERTWGDMVQAMAQPQNRQQLLVATRDDAVLGFAAFGPFRPAGGIEPAPADSELWALYLQPALQRSGIGRALWREGCRWLRLNGFDNLRLWVIEGNERAMAFYRAMGAQPASTNEFETHGKRLAEVCFRMALPHETEET
ncbi:MAG: GNAT family N-acetyltransferase [Pseudomonadota bacterium]